jgi:hypothetical protein
LDTTSNKEKGLLVKRQTMLVVMTMVFMGVAISLLFYLNSTPNISRQTYFVLLIILGLSFATFLTGVLKSIASLRRVRGNANIELGGPILAAILVVYFGAQYAPERTFA